MYIIYTPIIHNCLSNYQWIPPPCMAGAPKLKAGAPKLGLWRERPHSAAVMMYL